jgi:surface antigen
MTSCRRLFALAVATLLAVSACGSDDRTMSKENVGTAVGAVLGGLLGSQIGHGGGRVVGGVAGVLIGGFLGREIGKSMSERDREKASEAQSRAVDAPVGRSISWSNPESGNSGSITPTRDGRDSSGNKCREFRNTVTIDGKQEVATGTACQQNDGSWRVVN